MEHELRKITITVGSVCLQAELKTNKTANGIYEALPIESAFHTWGEEFYLKIPGVKDHRETATTKVKAGDIAFWGAGEVLAIFFGPTPMSFGPDPVPADRVNIVGRIVDDSSALRQAFGSPSIRIDKV